MDIKDNFWVKVKEQASKEKHNQVFHMFLRSKQSIISCVPHKNTFLFSWTRKIHGPNVCALIAACSGIAWSCANMSEDSAACHFKIWQALIGDFLGGTPTDMKLLHLKCLQTSSNINLMLSIVKIQIKLS